MEKIAECERSRSVSFLSGNMGIGREHLCFTLSFLLILSLVSFCWSTPTHAKWFSIGPYGGDICSLAVDPVNTETIYAGTQYNGLFKSIDGGKTWNPACAGLKDPDISSFAIDPVNSTTIYAGIGAGLYKSTNGGKSWSLTNLGANGRIQSIAIDPVNSKNIYAGAYGRGVYKSTNGGKSWTIINSGLPATKSFSVTVDPVDTQTVYAGTDDGAFKSTNGGKSWRKISSGLPNAGVGSVIGTINPKIIYAVVVGRGVFKNNRGGL